MNAQDLFAILAHLTPSERHAITLRVQVGTHGRRRRLQLRAERLPHCLVLFAEGAPERRLRQQEWVAQECPDEPGSSSASASASPHQLALLAEKEPRG